MALIPLAILTTLVDAFIAWVLVQSVKTRAIWVRGFRYRADQEPILYTASVATVGLGFLMIGTIAVVCWSVIIGIFH